MFAFSVVSLTCKTLLLFLVLISIGIVFFGRLLCHISILAASLKYVNRTPAEKWYIKASEFCLIF
jgi:hypothetical protein